MEKEQLIKYWKSESLRDWKRVELLFKNKDYVFALFCAHLSLEKILKAHWIKDNVNNHPPKIHNLPYLVSQTKLNASNEQMIFLEKMNTFQLEGRYPDYRVKINLVYNSKRTSVIIAEANSLRKWLIKNL